MSILEYLKDRLLYLIINFILFISIISVMIILKTPLVLIFITFLIWFLPIGIYFVIEILKYKRFYDNLNGVIEKLDRKYLLSELIEEPNFIEGRLFYNILKETNRDMNEEIKKYKNAQIDYREYIETWVHEIKTPIASSMLVIDNNLNETTNKIKYQIKRVEEFVEQVLYYSKIGEVSKDYIVKEFKIKTVINKVIKNNSRDFITKRISLEMNDLEENIYSDEKWIYFILNQIIGNSLKYSKDNDSKIKIYSLKNNHNVTLVVEDNGVGINNQDTDKVFEKGFTGENGRIYGRSTGMGLYICKKLSEKLGISISINSLKGQGTKVNIIFPIGKLTDM
ncbi:HAMP domain-containing histidine kinase [Clostridium botulinum]|uniref:sensor histidine kinase n=1 Tax=Clostridium TaxID=1485 RepID=UPI000501B8A2|nr:MULTISPECIES: sensor histidine kinase [unclassified Clostridium]AIY79423.1 histidine kinase-, DNA gyrase B-, and HSP90-like ATPase family protein [Clostridium botulinum 202F]KAI3344643.1 sensor histidine kinase [Clostridium botulinum]KFX59320.1 histidine kinase [Clostridium botulinum]KON14843.1 histidine kinase [Clostridium botulinum]MBY6805035.1 sensor histidine kinase [Clostridium botulinum]